MSISPLIAKKSFSELREKLGFELKLHGHQIVVGAIMTAVSIAIAVAMTGDWSDAFARSKR
jgi:hypothetical protein